VGSTMISPKNINKKHKIMNSFFLKVLSFLFFLLIFSFNSSEAQEPVTLPNGWKLSPAGRQLPLGDLPLHLVLSPNGRWAAVVNNGYGRQCIQMFNTEKQIMTDDVTISKSWYGLCFSPNGKSLYVSGGNDNMIRIYSVKKGMLTQKDSIVMDKPWPVRISPTGIDIGKKSKELYVLTKENNSLYIINLKTKITEKIMLLGGQGYDLKLSKDEKELYCSCWGSDSLKILNTQTRTWEKSLHLGSHPNEMCMDMKKERLFVANANDNTVSVIDLSNKKEVEVLNTSLSNSSKLSGSTTNGLDINKEGTVLAIANADNNALTLFDISEYGKSRCMGFIPTGWYPTNVKFVGNTLWVTNGKGFTSYSNPFGPKPYKMDEKFVHHTGNHNKEHKSQYIAGLFKGTLSIISVPDEINLKKYTAQVYDNTPYRKEREMLSAGEAGNPIPCKVGDPSPIKYVFYVIKENRTYDQVLGDMKEGNGDSSLVYFGEKVTPNHHALARQFVLLDNFYANAEVSADGHQWTMGGYANDYVEKSWPTSYSGRGGGYPGEGKIKIGNNRDGFLWNFCQRAGVSYRSYGEFCNYDKGALPVLKGHMAPGFVGWNLSIRDTVRFREWKEDFDSLLNIGALPRFNTVRMGGDHTEGLGLGRMTPCAHVADNDLAVGMLVDYISHSPIWRQTAIFIVEDDAQNGSDHVDAHRTTAYVVGGLVKRGFVDHTVYSTVSMVRTMELILGLPPMSQYDASAVSMWRCFTSKYDSTPFNKSPNQISLDLINEKKSVWQQKSEKFNFSKEDAIPDMEFNKVLWYGIKGDSMPMPSIKRSASIIYSDDDD